MFFIALHILCITVSHVALNYYNHPHNFVVRLFPSSPPSALRRRCIYNRDKYIPTFQFLLLMDENKR